MKFKSLMIATVALILLGAWAVSMSQLGSDSSPAAQAAPSPATKVDGHALYKQAFDLIVASDMALANEEVRNAWIQVWETKFQGVDLSTLVTTDNAIQDMCESVNAAYVRPQPTPEASAVTSKTVGIGITCELENVKELLKDVPLDTSAAEVDKAMKISSAHRFKITGVISGSPASQARLTGVLKSSAQGEEAPKVVTTMEEWAKRGLRAGQKLVLAGSRDGDRKLVDGLTLKEAIALIKGEAGSIVTLRVEDVDADGKPVELQFDCVRAPVRFKGAEAKPLSGGAWLLKVDNLGSPESTTDFLEAVKQAKDAKAVILDLRRLESSTIGNLDTVLNAFVSQGITYVLADRQGVNAASLTVDSQPYALSMRKNKSLNIDVVGFERPRPQTVIPAAVPVVVLTRGDGLGVASALFKTLKHHRPNTLLVGQAPTAKAYVRLVTPLGTTGRDLMVNSSEVLPAGGRDSSVLTPDRLLSDDELRSEESSIAAALKAVGINP